MGKINEWFKKNVKDEVANILFNFKFEINGKNIERDLKPDLIVDYDNLENQMIYQPSLFAFWSVILSEQKSEVSKIERQIKTRRSRLISGILKKDTNIAKWKIEEIIESDVKLSELENNLVLSKKKESILYAVIESLRIKNDMIRSLAGFKKIELQDS